MMVAPLITQSALASGTTARAAALAQSTSFCTVGAPLSDRPDNFSVHLDGKPATPRRYTRKRGDAGQKRRVALDKVEKFLSGDAEQRRIRLVLRNLDGRHRGPIHPAKGLEIAAVIENRHVLANAKFSGFRHCCIHHFLCELR